MKSTKAIVDGIDHPDWTIQEWGIKFVLSDELLHQVRKLSSVEPWYTDPVVVDTWLLKLSVCFTSIRLFYNTFGLLPQVGDRLSDDDTGLSIRGRSVDGRRKYLTFTLCL